MTIDSPERAPEYRPIPRLRKWLAKRGLRQHELAKMLGIRDATVSRYLTGQRSMPAAVALKLAELTGIPAEELSNREATTKLLKLLGKRTISPSR